MSSINFIRGNVKMTRQHFQFIADTVASCPAFQGTEHLDRRTLAKHFADALAATNSRFDREKFLEACKGDHDDHRG